MLRRRIVFYALVVLGLVAAGYWFTDTLRLEESRVADFGSRTIRPQEPRPPLPYIEEDVVILHSAAGVSLAGTLTLPVGAAKNPAILLIAGTGPQDRDSSGANHRPFLVLADHLTRHGIAVLRCDRRGAGNSTGNFDRATEDDFAHDTVATLDYLRGRPEVDPRRVGLLGHSQGGVIAMRANEKSPVAFLVLLASPGLPLVDVKSGQFRAAARAFDIDPALIENWTATYRDYASIVSAGTETSVTERAIRELWRRRVLGLSESQRKTLGISDTALNAMLVDASHPGFVSALHSDPRMLLASVRCPVLALHGERDVQVNSVENLAAIRAALVAAGNGAVRTVSLPRLNHVFQTARTGQVSEYAEIDETFNPKALHLISEWIQANTK